MTELAERIVKAAAEAMGSTVAVDLGEHRDVAAAVIRALATNPGCDPEFRAQFRDLAEQIAPTGDLGASSWASGEVITVRSPARVPETQCEECDWICDCDEPKGR